MISRRSFFKLTGATLATATTGSAKAEVTESTKGMGCLVDLSLCTGCRKCEAACNEINEDLPRKPPEAFDDNSVFARRRRMESRSRQVRSARTARWRQSVSCPGTASPRSPG